MVAQCRSAVQVLSGPSFLLHRERAPRAVSAAASACGCRIKPFEKTRSTLAEEHLRAAVHDALATDRLRATDEMAVFGTHPYKRSSVLAWGFPDSHRQMR